MLPIDPPDHASYPSGHATEAYLLSAAGKRLAEETVPFFLECPTIVELMDEAKGEWELPWEGRGAAERTDLLAARAPGCSETRTSSFSRDNLCFQCVLSSVGRAPAGPFRSGPGWSP